MDERMIGCEKCIEKGCRDGWIDGWDGTGSPILEDCPCVCHWSLADLAFDVADAEIKRTLEG